MNRATALLYQAELLRNGYINSLNDMFSDHQLFFKGFDQGYIINVKFTHLPIRKGHPLSAMILPSVHITLKSDVSISLSIGQALNIQDMEDLARDFHEMCIRHQLHLLSPHQSTDQFIS